MPFALVSAEVVIGCAVVLVALFLAWTFVRRSVICRGRTVLVCGWRGADVSVWQAGLLGLEGEQLEWFPLSGVRIRPRFCWDRTGLEVDVPRPVPSTTGLGIDGSAFALTCRYGDTRFDITLDDPSYTALRSWLDSVPPGYNVNVA
ncbi:MAG TPA: DUF2550 family protein [Candidatus Lustribacter sp.]|nr:DUF2550 family protein [Candidatus Lustribacter sp.]